jgi:mannose-6-phosphate isomerase
MITIEKPWGKEELIEVNDRYVLKRLTMLAGHRCSLQYHLQKIETIIVVSGKLRIQTGENPNHLISKDYGPGDSITIAPRQIHRMEGVDDCVYLEASTPELDDVVRLKDDYNRTEAS